MSWLEAVLNFIGRYSWRSLIGIFVATGAVLFYSDPLGVSDWARPLRGWFWLGFIFSGVVLLTYPCSAIYQGLAISLRGVLAICLNRIQLHKLTAAEKALCKHIVDTDGTPMLHNPTDGAISALVRKRILIPASVPLHNGMCNYTMPTWALEYLKRHQELLK